MCSCDYVELRDGAKASGPLIGRYCEAKASTVYSEGRHMWVKFKSDRENEGRGFLANYTFNIRVVERGVFFFLKLVPCVNIFLLEREGG